MAYQMKFKLQPSGLECPNSYWAINVLDIRPIDETCTFSLIGFVDKAARLAFIEKRNAGNMVGHLDKQVQYTISVEEYRALFATVKADAVTVAFEKCYEYAMQSPQNGTPAVPAVEAVLDADGNVVKPAVPAVPAKSFFEGAIAV